MEAFIPISLAALFGLSLITTQAVRRLPLKELRQRSRFGHDRSAAAIYRLSTYGASGRLVVWLVGAASLAGLLLIAFNTKWWLGLITVLLANALIVGWDPVRSASGLGWSLAAVMAGLIAYLLSYIKSAVEGFNRRVARFHRPPPTGRLPSGIYEKEDLLELLKIQVHQPDNRVGEADLRRAAQALSFNDKTVGQVMIPFRDVKWLAANELIGPTIMDELHKTGQVRFPVVKSDFKPAKPEIIGSLYIGKLLKHLDEDGKLRDLMSPGAAYINEACDLEQALDAYTKTGSQLLIAVNGRGEIAGVLPIETVLNEALGDIVADDFEDYDNPRLAADHEPHRDLE